jgi:hypothetical protein
MAFTLMMELVSLWLYKKTTSYGTERKMLFTLHIPLPPPELHTLMTSLF